jgi:uncharacterized membrane protein YbhN (UPF0104 family)
VSGITQTGVEPVSDRGVRTTEALRRTLRFFSAPKDQPRARRATDVLLLVPALIGLAILVGAYPPGDTERALLDFIHSVPDWLQPVWAFAYDLMILWAIVLAAATLLGRRTFLALQVLGAVILALVVALVAARIAIGHWPDIGRTIDGESDSAFPSSRLAESFAVAIVVLPNLVAPLRRTTRSILVFGFVGAVFANGAVPGGNLAGVLIAFVAASGIRLAFGTSAGRPSLNEVRTALAALGVDAEGVEAAERQGEGVFIVHARDSEGRTLYAKVYGRDAYDTQLLSKFWRTLWYRDGGPALGLTRGQTAEHEAFVTLLARNAGVPTVEVVTAGSTPQKDAILVLRGEGRTLSALGKEGLSDERLRQCWRSLSLLGRANIAHLRIDPSTVVALDGEMGLVNFVGATVSPSEEQLMTDKAQLLAATATVVGGERALAAAEDTLGQNGLHELLSYLQVAALSTSLRHALKQSGTDIDELRKLAAAKVGVQDPDLVKLRRISLWSFVQVVLLVLAAYAIITYFGGINWTQVKNDLKDASWAWLVLGFILAQTPRLTQAVGTLGSVPARLPYGPVYALQLATCYLNLALPSAAARMAISIRFFQRQGLSGAIAVASGLINSFANNVVQGVLLVLLLLFSSATISLQLGSPSGDSLRILWLLVGLLVLTVLIVVIVPRFRRAVVGAWGRWWPDLRSSLASLRASNKLLLLFGGNVATEVLFAASLGVFVRAFGYPLPLTTLLVINMSVSLLSTFIPVPGGMGVSEFGLTTGLVAAGLPQETAFAAVLMYRIATFYLPPVWGFFALRWLQRNKYL